MEPETWTRLKAIFDRAVEMEGREQESFVEQACGGDDALAAMLRNLLDADKEAGDFLSAPVLAPRKATTRAP